MSNLPVFQYHNYYEKSDKQHSTHQQYAPYPKHEDSNIRMDRYHSGSLTRSRNSLPGLKCGTNLPSSRTDSPVLGLRPTRGAR